MKRDAYIYELKQENEKLRKQHLALADQLAMCADKACELVKFDQDLMDAVVRWQWLAEDIAREFAEHIEDDEGPADIEAITNSLIAEGVNRYMAERLENQ